MSHLVIVIALFLVLGCDFSRQFEDEDDEDDYDLK